METDIGQITQTNMTGSVTNYQVSAKVIDEGETERTWQNPYWTTYLGYLKSIPEYRNAVYALAKWSCGLGWTCELDEDKVTLERLQGWGKDSFDSIIQDMVVVMKTNGDAYAEIVRNDQGTLINLKKLNPSRVWHVLDKNGLLEKYQVRQADGKMIDFQPYEILHFCNDRIANEMHGTSVLQSCQNVIDWKNEIMSDLRRVMHRSTIRCMYIDMDNTTRLTTVKTEYASAIKNGELLIIPAKKGEAEFEDLTVPPTEAYMTVVRWLDNYFYEVLGVPKIITGGTQEYSEASSKMGYMSFEVPHSALARYVETEMFNQLAIRIEFEKPVSLKESQQEAEAKNTGQVGIQPNETTPTAGRNE